MATPDDRHPVQALGADRRTQRSAYALALGARTGVTSTSPASARNLSLKPWLPHHQQQVTGLLVTQLPLGLAVTPASCTQRVSSSMKHSTCSRLSQTVSTERRKSHATIPAAC